MPTRTKDQNTLVLGDYNVICDICGFKFKASDTKPRWDGLTVCEDDWEPRHPADFFRSRAEDQTVEDASPDNSGNGPDSWIQNNAFLYSNAPDTSPWSTEGSPTITGNQSDPDGGTDAWKITQDGVTNSCDIWQIIQDGAGGNYIIDGTSIAISVSVKYGDYSPQIIGFSTATIAGNPSIGSVQINYDGSGNITSVVKYAGNVSGISWEDLGSGWYRIKYIAHPPSSYIGESNCNWYFIPGKIIADGSNYFGFCYQMQIELHSYVHGGYVETTSAQILTDYWNSETNIPSGTFDGSL